MARMVEAVRDVTGLGGLFYVRRVRRLARTLAEQPNGLTPHGPERLVRWGSVSWVRWRGDDGQSGVREPRRPRSPRPTMGRALGAPMAGDFFASAD